MGASTTSVKVKLEQLALIHLLSLARKNIINYMRIPKCVNIVDVRIPRSKDLLIVPLMLDHGNVNKKVVINVHKDQRNYV
jgi:hypothetical protein